MKRLLFGLVFLIGCDTDADKDGYNSEVDCDDTNADIYPGAPDAFYDGIDSDCAGDDDYDQDLDGFQDVSGGGTDCDDTNPDIHPEASEVCDTVDNDCNDLIDDNATDGLTLYVDADNDGFGDDAETIVSCDAEVEGYTDNADDCDDDDETMSPDGTEVCDEKDNDCNSIVDDNASDAQTWYEDADRDGYGNPDTMTSGCDVPADSADNGDDCNDAYADIVTCESVYELQDGSIALDTFVVVDRMIVTGFNKFGAFIQHEDGGPYSAIWAYGGSGSTEGLNIGDVVSIGGMYLEYRDLTEIDFSSEGWLINDGPGTPIVPEVVTTKELADPTTAEQWESVLIQVNDVTVTDEDVGFGEWEITDSIRIDDSIFSAQDAYPSLSVGDTFDSIAGPLYYSYSAFKIEPRNADDLVGYEPSTKK